MVTVDSPSRAELRDPGAGRVGLLGATSKPWLFVREADLRDVEGRP
jgi:hypothetical protein